MDECRVRCSNYVAIYIHVWEGAPPSAIERFYGIHTTCVRECMGEDIVIG